MKKMNEKKFLQQMYGKLENQLEQEVKLADDSIEISEGDKVIFKIAQKPHKNAVKTDCIYFDRFFWH